jgi:hypothetical protein
MQLKTISFVRKVGVSFSIKCPQFGSNAHIMQVTMQGYWYQPHNKNGRYVYWILYLIYGCLWNIVQSENLKNSL